MDRMDLEYVAADNSKTALTAETKDSEGKMFKVTQVNAPVFMVISVALG
jgi:hypothetical protein